MSNPSIERNAQRLRIYIGESDQWQGKPLYAALLDQLKQSGMAGATVTRGVAGFGAHSRIHTAAILRLSEDLPLIVEVVDSPEKIRLALESIRVMVNEGLITVEPVEVIAYTHRYLHPLPADRPVAEIMTHNPVTVRAGDSALEAWERMLQHNLKSLPVLDEDGRVAGVLTFEDYLERVGLNARLAVAQRLDEDSLRAEMDVLRRSQLKVSNVMSKPPVTVQANETVGLAAQRMVEHEITRLPVIDESGKLVGVVSRLDLLRQVMNVPHQAHKHTAAPVSGRLAGEIMSTDVPQVRQDERLSKIISAFLSSGQHRLIVVDGKGRPAGLISDSDVVGRIQPPLRKGILGALRGRNRPPDVSITAAELMSPGVETITADTTLVEAIQKMLPAGRKWLVVVDVEGKPVGLVDREIALRALIR